MCPAAYTQSTSVQWRPKRIVNGSPMIITVRPAVRLQSLSGKWLDHDVFFSYAPKQKLWIGFAGAGLKTTPGRYILQLTGDTTHDTRFAIERKIAVAKAKYRSIAVSVPEQFTKPSEEQLREIAGAKAIKQDVLSRVTPERQWSGAFDAPVNAAVSDVFGTARTFNGETQGVHEGLDFGVPSGTPVHAINGGTVILARPLFFEGNFVVVDHGQGLLSMYMHLSKFEAKEGDHVEKGQELGLSGGSGRATGPHLHIAVRWQGIYLDPAILLKLRVP